MLSWDKTYLEAKEIKENKRSLSIEFQMLKEYLFQEFNVEILNGDIYEEPVVKNLPLKLRIIIADSDWLNKLPVKHDLKKRLIADIFIDIIRKNSIEKYPVLEKGKLDVQYVLYAALRLEEIRRKVSMSKIKDRIGDKDILEIHTFTNTYYIFYRDKEVLEKRKKEGIRIQKIIIELIKEAGYEGILIDKIRVTLDEIGTLKNAGSFYNYLR